MATKSLAFLTLLMATTMTVEALRLDDEEDAAPRRTFETGEMLAPGAEPMPIDDDTMTLLEADPPPAEGMPSEDAQVLSDEAQGEGQDAATTAAPQQEDEDEEETTTAEKTNSGVLQKNMKQAGQKAYEDANCSAPGVPSVPSDELPVTFETLESTKKVLKVKTEEQVAQLKGEVTEKTEKRVAKQAYQAHERNMQAAMAATEKIIAPGAAAAGDVTQAAAPTEQEEQVVEQAAEEEATTEAATTAEAGASEGAVQEEAPVEAANSLQENEPVQEDEEISEEATDEAADGEVPEGGEEEIRAGIHDSALARYSKVAAERYIHGAEGVTKESVERAKSKAMQVVELRAEAKARKEAAWREDQAEQVSDGDLQHHVSVLKDHQGAWTKWTSPGTDVA